MVQKRAGQILFMEFWTKIIPKNKNIINKQK
jgi:hypothetical protein